MVFGFVKFVVARLLVVNPLPTLQLDDDEDDEDDVEFNKVRFTCDFDWSCNKVRTALACVSLSLPSAK